MLNAIYKNPTTIYFGKDSINNIASELYGKSKNVLLVFGNVNHDRHSIKKIVREKLNALGCNLFEIGGVKPNPTIDLAYDGINICTEKSIDYILCIGGGSTIDIGKTIAIGAEYDGDVFDFYNKKSTPTTMIKLGVILTIAGAGSESSDGAVISRYGRKFTCGAPCMYPTFAVLDPSYTESVPIAYSTYGVVDAISHVMERYFSSTQSVNVSGALSEALIRELIVLGEMLGNHPDDYDIRSEIMWASKLAHDNTTGFGRKHDWATHTIANQIGGMFDVPHGALLAVIFPAWMEYVVPGNIEIFYRFGKNIFSLQGDQDVVALAGISAYRKFLKAVQMPSKLTDICSISERDFEEIAEACSQTTLSGTIGNLQRLDIKDVTHILKSCL